MKATLLTSLVFVLFVAAFAPSLSESIMAHAAPENSIRLSVFPDRAPGKNGWYSGPVQVTAKTNSPDIVITYAVNGGEAVAGESLLLERPGEYEIAWNACKGENCHDGFLQSVKILPELRQLSYNPDQREWSFVALVTEVRRATLLGQPGRVARVQAKDFSAWVVLEVSRAELADTAIRPGDIVEVWIAGPHVSLNEVDWSQCGNVEGRGVSSYEYCSMGEVLDDGLVSLDSGYKLSPSNELIREGRTSQRWQAGVLYWNMSLMESGQAEMPRERLDGWRERER